MPNDGIRLKIILIIEVRKLEFTDFDSHSPLIQKGRCEKTQSSFFTAPNPHTFIVLQTFHFSYSPVPLICHPFFPYNHLVF